MAEDRDESASQRKSILGMIASCKAMQDEAKALEVRSVIAHDEVVMSVVPFLLSLYSHEEEANSSAMTGVGKSKKSDILC